MTPGAPNARDISRLVLRDERSPSRASTEPASSLFPEKRLSFPRTPGGERVTSHRGWQATPHTTHQRRFRHRAFVVQFGMVGRDGRRFTGRAGTIDFTL